MPSQVKGYPIDSVNILHARVTVNPVPRMKMINGTITPPRFQLTESEAMGMRRL